MAPTERQMASVRWLRLQKMAADKRDRSIFIGKKHTRESFYESQKLWNDANRLSKKADKLYKKYLGVAISVNGESSE